jgi:hypothetical protein
MLAVGSMSRRSIPMRYVVSPPFGKTRQSFLILVGAIRPPGRGHHWLQGRVFIRASIHHKPQEKRVMDSVREKNYIRWFETIKVDDLPLVGGKNASLG